MLAQHVRIGEPTCVDDLCLPRAFQLTSFLFPSCRWYFVLMLGALAPFAAMANAYGEPGGWVDGWCLACRAGGCGYRSRHLAADGPKHPATLGCRCGPHRLVHCRALGQDCDFCFWRLGRPVGQRRDCRWVQGLKGKACMGGSLPCLWFAATRTLHPPTHPPTLPPPGHPWLSRSATAQAWCARL